MTDGIERKVTESGGSLKIVIPKQLAQLYGIENGDTIEWTQGGPGELRLKKV
jgi:bifunctional DNA-binding transcriptional regulator/antitoxin component of YhaV-PrlF toxin-antitoxin module